MALTARNLNRQLKRMGYEIEFWYDRSGGTWVIAGIDKNGDWFSKATYVYRLNMMTFDEWIDEAISHYNTDNATRGG